MIDWFDLAIQGTLRTPPAPEFESINSSALRLLYSPTLTFVHVTTGKTIALTTWTFIGKVMSVLFNTLPRFIRAFLPRSKHLLIWLQSLSSDFEA